MQAVVERAKVRQPLRVGRSTMAQSLKDAIMAELKAYGSVTVDAIGAHTSYIASKAFILARGHAMCFGSDLIAKLSYVNIRLDHKPTDVKTAIRWLIEIEGERETFMEAL